MGFISPVPNSYSFLLGDKMKFKCQSLASAVIADKKSTVSDEQIEDMIFKSMLSEHMNTIVDGGSE